MTRGRKNLLNHPLTSAFQKTSSCCKVYATFHRGQGKDLSFTVVEGFKVGRKERRNSTFPWGRAPWPLLETGFWKSLGLICRTVLCIQARTAAMSHMLQRQIPLVDSVVLCIFFKCVKALACVLRIFQFKIYSFSFSLTLIDASASVDFNKKLGWLEQESFSMAASW